MYIKQSELIKLKEYEPYISAIRHNDIYDLKQLSEIMNISWGTAKKNIEYLLEMGVIKERKKCETEQEPNFPRYTINNEYGYLLAIAIGATEVKVVITDYSFEPIKSSNGIFSEYISKIIRYFKKDASGKYLCCSTKKDYLFIRDLCTKVISEALDFFKNSQKVSLISIGISIPGIINRQQGTISFSPTFLELQNLSLNSLIHSDVLNRIKEEDVCLDFFHDSISALVYEKERLFFLGNAERKYAQLSNIASLYMGSGLSGAFIIKNRLIQGATSAAEIGHLDMYYDDNIFDEEELSDIEAEDKKYYKFKDEKKPEPNIDITHNPCSCGKKYCLEHLIRVKVFNSGTTEDFINKTSGDELKKFAKSHPYRYKVLKYFISQIFNIIINLLNVDVIVLTGRVLNGIPELKSDIEGLAINSALRIYASHCHIIKGSERPDSAAIGASILSYYSIMKDDMNICW